MIVELTHFITLQRVSNANFLRKFMELCVSKEHVGHLFTVKRTGNAEKARAKLRDLVALAPVWGSWLKVFVPHPSDQHKIYAIVQIGLEKCLA